MAWRLGPRRARPERDLRGLVICQLAEACMARIVRSAALRAGYIPIGAEYVGRPRRRSRQFSRAKEPMPTPEARQQAEQGLLAIEQGSGRALIVVAVNPGYGRLRCFHVPVSPAERRLVIEPDKQIGDDRSRIVQD